jgi:hypothetical protein
MKIKGDPPLNKKIAFIIRDDDISYFTQPWMLDLLYDEAWRLGFKVSLAVIPNVKADKSRHVPPPFRGINKFFKISENRELVDYLLKKIEDGCIDIVQHGYTHAHEDGKPEFAINNFKLVDEKLRKGNKILQETFKREVTVFTAPYEMTSRATWKSLSRNKMGLCRRFTLGRLLLTAPTPSINFHKLARIILRRPNPFKLLPNSVIDLTDTLVVQRDLYLSDPKTQLKSAKERFLKRLSEGGAFLMLHHHWGYFYNWEIRTIKKEPLAYFNSFLSFVSSKSNVWKTSLSELYSWLKLARDIGGANQTEIKTPHQNLASQRLSITITGAGLGEVIFRVVVEGRPCPSCRASRPWLGPWMWLP